jgi:hypothetical protein
MLLEYAIKLGMLLEYDNRNILRETSSVIDFSAYEFELFASFKGRSIIHNKSKQYFSFSYFHVGHFRVNVQNFKNDKRADWIPSSQNLWPFSIKHGLFL